MPLGAGFKLKFNSIAVTINDKFFLNFTKDHFTVSNVDLSTVRFHWLHRYASTAGNLRTLHGVAISTSSLQKA